MLIPKTMRAMVYRGANDLRLETVPVPEIRAGELLVKVAVCGVCPTDIKKIHYGTVAPPRIFGHETAGVVVKTGAGVKHFKVGDRVALHHHVPCLKCHFCRHAAFAQCPDYKRTGITAGFEPAGGGYAEYVRVMKFVLPGVVKIPARNSFAEGAMLEPVNTVLKAVNRLGLLRGDSVVVIGQGPIGLMFTRLLKLRGMKVVATDLMASRLALAREWGAVAAFNGDDSTARPQGSPPPPQSYRHSNLVEKGSKILAAHENFGASRSTLLAKVRKIAPCVDAVVVAVPSQAAVSQAFEMARGSGKVLLFAHTRRGEQGEVDLSAICVEEKDLVGSYSSDFTLQEEVAGLVFGRKLDVRRLITHEFSLEQTAAAVALAAAPTQNSLKIIVNQQK